MTEQNRTEMWGVMEKHVAELAEHFDSVQIFVTKHDGGKERTRTGQLGAGNWYARFGQVREWVVREEERAREDVRSDMTEGKE